jgi:hypothetical protein
MFNPLRTILELLAAVSLLSTALADERWAPHAVAGPVNQLDISGNACGPAALLTSFRCGAESWRAVSERIPGASDKSKLLYIIRAHGLRPSTSLKDRKRWTQAGVNVEDLTVIAGELAALTQAPAPRMESLMRNSRETPEKLVSRMHARLRNSLKQGFPPILSLRRYVFRDGKWQAVQGHFVTIVQVPEKIPRRSTNFDFTYFDPWEGQKETGSFTIPEKPVLTDATGAASCLVALAPKANVGKSKVRRGEATAVVPTVILGRW